MCSALKTSTKLSQTFIKNGYCFVTSNIFFDNNQIDFLYFNDNVKSISPPVCLSKKKQVAGHTDHHSINIYVDNCGNTYSINI